MIDVAKMLKVPQKRADVIGDECYKAIANLDGSKNSLKNAIQYVYDMAGSDGERFYVGFVFGRIIQINEAAQGEASSYIEHHCDELTKAKDALSEHPEFG